jgi:hypothetical protein
MVALRDVLVIVFLVLSLLSAGVSFVDKDKDETRHYFIIHVLYLILAELLSR